MRPGLCSGDAEARILELEAELDSLRTQVGRAACPVLTDHTIMALDAQGNVTSWAAPRMMQSAGPELSSCLGLPSAVEAAAPASLAIRPEWTFDAGRTGETWCPRGDGTRFRAHEILLPLLDADQRAQGSLRIMWEASDQPMDAAVAPSKPVRRWAETPVRGIVLAVALSAPIYIGIGMAIRWMLS